MHSDVHFENKPKGAKYYIVKQRERTGTGELGKGQITKCPTCQDKEFEIYPKIYKPLGGVSDPSLN